MRGKRVLLAVLSLAVLGVTGVSAQGVLRSPSQKSSVKTAIRSSNKSILKRGVVKKKPAQQNPSPRIRDSYPDYVDSVVYVEEYNPNIELILADVNASNSTCPQKISDEMTMTSIRFDEPRRVLSFNYTVDSSVITASAMREGLSDYASNMETLKDMAEDDEMKVLLTALAEENGSIELNFYMKRERTNVRQEYTTSDITSALRYVSSPSYTSGGNGDANGTKYKDVDMIVSNTNLGMPMKIDDSTILESLSRDGSLLYYNYTLVEDGFTAEQIAPFKNSIRATIEKNFDNALTQRLLQTLIDADITLIHRYVGNKSGGSFDIVFTPSDLRSLKK